MAPEISTGKSICILGTVIACFAVLWPNIFYPMLKGSVSVSSDDYYRQERKSRAKEALHPAFRKVTPPNRKALPDVDPSAIYHDEDILPPPIAAMQHEPLPGKKPPIPGMRPTVGGNGYIAQQKGSGTMGILMPMYTIGIVAFFTYTILKLLSKKPENRSNFIHDPDFCQNVFSNNDPHEKTTSNTAVDPASKLGWQEKDIRDIEIDHLRRRLAETEATMDRIVKQMNLVSKTLAKPLNENGISSNAEAIVIDKVNDDNDIKTEKLNGVIKVVGMELNESCENGKPWTRSPSSPTTKTEPVPPPPHEIMLPGNVPVNSQILVSDAHTENVSNESSVILESKVTLNVISPDLENGKEMDKSEINGVVHNGNGEGSGVIVNGGDSAQEEEEDEEVEVEEEEEEEIEVEEEEEEEIEVEEEEEEEIEVEDESEIDYDNNKVIVNKNVENIDKSGVEDRNTEL